MNKFINIGEHKFILPEPPTKASNVLFSKEKKSEQFWRRQMDFPEYFWKWTPDVILNADYTVPNDEGGGFKSLDRKDTKILSLLQTRELTRRQQGIWFMNNGELTYLTGDHYFTLQWYSMGDAINHVEPGSKYGAYLQFQRNFFYFNNIAENTPNGYGGYFIKAKKTGITQCASGVCLNRATMSSDILIKIMSKNHPVAKEVNFQYISRGIDSLPNILCPEIRTKNLGRVFFGSEDDTKTSKQRERIGNKTFLNSQIITVPTNIGAMDTTRNYLAWIDEFPKIDMPLATHLPTIASVCMGSLKVGFVLYTSYTPEGGIGADGERVKASSIKEAEQLYWESKLSTINYNNSPLTKSGLISYCLPVQEGIFGNVDRFGLPETKKIYAFLEEGYQARKHNPDALIGFKKQQPTSEKEAWAKGGDNQSVFNLIRLSERLTEINMQEANNELPMVRGSLEWNKSPVLNPLTDTYDFYGCSVYFKQDTEQDKKDGKPAGEFVFYDINTLPNDKYNAYTIDRDNKLRKPKDDTPYFLSFDPTNYNLKSMVAAGSQNALMGFILPDSQRNSYYGRKVTHRQFLQYLCRKEKPKEVVWDLAKAIIYTGAYLLSEGNMPGYVTRLIEIGLGNYIFVKTKDGAFEPYSEYKNKQKHYVTTNNTQNGDGGTIGEYIMATMNYLGEPELDKNGKLKEGEFDNLENIYSAEVIGDLMDFKREDTKEFDAGVAFMIGIMGMNAYLGWRRAELLRNNRCFDAGKAAAFRSLMH